MIFDTDIFIWIQRGNARAARLVESDETRSLSVLTYMELLQCAENRRQQDVTRAFLKDLQFVTLPLTENVGHRAAVYIDEYSLSHGLRAADALIAATAAENNLELCSGNARHFRAIQDLKLKIFRP